MLSNLGRAARSSPDAAEANGTKMREQGDKSVIRPLSANLVAKPAMEWATAPTAHGGDGCRVR